MEKYRSCHSVEGELFFNHLNRVGYCCMLTPNGGQPILYENYQGELIDWEEFFLKRDEHIELMKNGGTLPACSDCLWIKNAKWDERKKNLKYILLNIWVKCNLFCIYCSNHTDTHVMNNTIEYNIIPVIQDMINKKVITVSTKIDIAGGEATLDKNFQQLLDLLIDSGIKNINVNTNATIFSPGIQRGIELGVISVISSVDSGSEKVFKFIKKKNLWNNVWTNLSKYSSVQKQSNQNAVKAKYIIIPTVNDNKEEIKNFLIKVKKAGINSVILNIDLHWLRNNSYDIKTMKKVIVLTKYFISLCSYISLDWNVWAHIEDLIKRYNRLNPQKKIEIDFIFNKFQKTKLSLFEKIIINANLSL